MLYWYTEVIIIKKKKRRLKKWVKKALLILLLLIFILIILTLKHNTKNNNKLINKDIKQKEIIKEELERNTYKEGFYYENLSKEIKERITGLSFPKEFNPKYEKISYEDLKYLRLKYYDFNNKEHTDGEMIVNKVVALEVLKIFYELYENKYPIEKIKLVEEYNASDELSMEDNNTSAFNYRILENDTKLSWHCFGLAIDINPLYNPYILGNDIYPKKAAKYTNRTKNFPGKIDYNDLAYKTFTKYNWKWGGNFINSKDYQHFYKDIYEDKIRESKE